MVCVCPINPIAKSIRKDGGIMMPGIQVKVFLYIDNVIVFCPDACVAWWASATQLLVCYNYQQLFPKYFWPPYITSSSVFTLLLQTMCPIDSILHWHGNLPKVVSIDISDNCWMVCSSTNLLRFPTRLFYWYVSVNLSLPFIMLQSVVWTSYSMLVGQHSRAAFSQLQWPKFNPDLKSWLCGVCRFFL